MDKLEFIINYIESGEKPESEQNLGVECEHLILKEDGRAVGYFDNGGTQDIFNDLVKNQGFEPHIEEGKILSCKKGEFSISTEPGGQIEFSSKQKRCVKTVEAGILDFYDLIIPEINKYGNGLYTVPFQPVSRIEDYEILPKERYYAMFDYFKTHGRLSHLMMKGTTSLQCSIDFHNEKDYSRKYGMATRLTNIFYTLFDNVAFKENRPLDIYAYRAKIWEHTDPQRTGVLERAFRADFSYADYAKKVLDTDAIFTLEDGNFKRFDGTIGEAIGEDFDVKKLEHLLTMVFFDVRSKRFIEIRMIDSLPWPYNIGAVALINNVFYNDDNLDRMWNMLGDMTYKEHLRSREEIYKKGPQAKLMGKKISRWGEEILSALDVNDYDRKSLEKIVPLMEGNTLRNKQLEIYNRTYNVKEAMEINKVKTIPHTSVEDLKHGC